MDTLEQARDKIAVEFMSGAIMLVSSGDSRIGEHDLDNLYKLAIVADRLDRVIDRRRTMDDGK